MADTARTLIWSDEFDGPANSPPDRRWWRHETGGHGWGNGELQHYTDDLANAAHDGQGNLIITARHTGNGYTSARLTSKDLFTFRYGRLECRAAVPAGAGLWSAIWTLGSTIEAEPWPACGEIDMMEHVGAVPNRVFGTVHCPGHCGRDGISGGLEVARPLSDFHIFAVDWWPDRIEWSLDGACYFAVSAEALGSAWVFDKPFYLLLNLAVGGWLGGSVAPETVFPAAFKLDYVRIYAAPAHAVASTPREFRRSR